MSHSNPLDDTIKHELRHLERQARVDPRAREEARRRMLEAYLSVGETGRNPEIDEGELVRLIGADEPIADPRPAWRHRAVAAVLVLVVAGGMFVLANKLNSSSIDQAIPVADHELPTRLLPGVYSSEVLGTNLTFTVTEPTWLIREDPGLLEFASGPNSRDSTRLLFARPVDPSAQIGGSLADWMASSSQLTYQRTLTTVDGRTTDSWGAWVTDAAISSSGCEVGDPCVGVFSDPEIGLRAGGSNDVLQINQDQHPPLFAFVWRAPGDAGVPLGGFNNLMESVVLGEPKPPPQP